MFAWWGRIVYRYRFIVIGVMVAVCLGGGIFGLGIHAHGTGGYAVAPPSRQLSGRELEWVQDPSDVLPADLPEHLLRRLTGTPDSGETAPLLTPFGTFSHDVK